MKKTVDYKERACAICGKSFVICDDWAYKQRTGKKGKTILYFCSWKHSRQYEAEHVPARKMKASATHC